MSQPQRPSMGFYQMLVFLLILVVILAVLVVGGTATGGATGATPEALATKEVVSAATAEATVEATNEVAAGMPSVFFISPADGATVPTTFTVQMGADGLLIEPAGDVHEGAGHFHIIIDAPFVEPGEIIPSDDQHLHFGKAQTEAELTLTPGEHTLRLQFADGAHTALEGDQYRDEITVTVEG